ncbi:MAG: hypothetical protein Kow0080_28190 [Candidatus Promineifilaceae bacterium]
MPITQAKPKAENMATKLLMSWNVRPETENEYFEFLVHDFIPGLNRLGITEIQVWYTAFGDCEQKMASGIVPTKEDMAKILKSEEWETLNARLQQFVTDYRHKVINGTRGFQL